MSSFEQKIMESKGRATELRLPALQVQQSECRTLYSFAVDGKTLHQFAAVSQLRRDENRVIHGYQRPEVLKHIGEIRRYLESTAPMIPNAIVIAFDERVKFKPHNQVNDCSYSQHGELVIPLDSADGGEKLPGWIVDGQQRAAAIRDAEIGSFPVCVTAFVTNDLQEQREQFILVNTTKPLPKGLIYELLPSTRSRLPTSFQRRRFPAKLMNRLNNESHSPFHRLIQTPTTPTGIVKDNSILRMLTNSLTDGALHPYRDPAGEGDEEMMVSIIYAFWSSVKRIFPQAWGEKPRRSRLMHGVGIVAMGYLMDAIADRYRSNTLSTELFQQDIEILSDAQIFSWTNGYWHFGPDDVRKWNDIQNTSKDIFKLGDFILSEYKRLVWSRQRL